MAEEQVNQNEQEQAQVEEKIEEVKETKPKEKMFTEDQVLDMITNRLAQERGNIYKKLGVKDIDIAVNAIKNQKELQEKQQIQKGEFEEILKTKTSEFNTQLNDLQNQLKDIKINKALLSSASKNKAINPEQVVELLKTHIQLNESGNAEILDSKGIARYNNKGELFSTDDLVEEFLTQNPHFVSATPGGSGTKSNVDRNDSRTPFKLEDLDMNNPEHRKQYAEYRRRRDSKPTVINLNK